MAKKRAGQQLSIADPETGESIAEEVPEALADLAEAYDGAHTAHGKSKAKLNTATENLIAGMKEHGIPRCPIRNGQKVLELSVNEKVLYKKPKKKPELETAGGVPDDDDEVSF